ncbi:MAG: HD domain-containing protein, partial [Acidobacteria bacterium]
MAFVRYDCEARSQATARRYPLQVSGTGASRTAGFVWEAADIAWEIAAHGRRLAHAAVRFASRIGLSAEETELIRLGALLHDVGKHAIPPDLLLKRSPLTELEFAIVREHPAIGERMCSQVSSARNVRSIVRHHHERLDGSGYPDRIGAGEIGLLPQIVGMIDVYDALCHPRAYKPALAVETACAMLVAEAARGWRSRGLVGAFVEMILAAPPSAGPGEDGQGALHAAELHVEHFVPFV